MSINILLCLVVDRQYGKKLAILALALSGHRNVKLSPQFFCIIIQIVCWKAAEYHSSHTINIPVRKLKVKEFCRVFCIRSEHFIKIANLIKQHHIRVCCLCVQVIQPPRRCLGYLFPSVLGREWIDLWNGFTLRLLCVMGLLWLLSWRRENRSVLRSGNRHICCRRRLPYLLLDYLRQRIVIELYASIRVYMRDCFIIAVFFL